MAWAALGKGLMGTARAVGGGARMAKSIFKRKGGKNAPEKPASEQTVDVEAQEVKVRPSTSLIPTAPAAAIVNDTSASSGDDVEEVAIRIKTNLISVEKLLSNSYIYREKVREDEKKQLEDAKRAKAEDEAEKPEKKKSKFELPGKKQVTSFFDKLKNFLMSMFLSAFLGQLMDASGPLMKIVKVLAKVVDIAINIAGWVLNFVATIVDAAYSLIEGMRGLVKNVFGEKGLEVFDSFLNTLKNVINLIGSVGLVFAALGGVGMITKLIAFLKGGSALATVAGGGGAATTGGAAATAGGIGTAATVGIVAGAGLLASGLGEGAFQIKKKGQEAEEAWFKRYKEKWWTDPRKAVDWGILQIIKGFNFVVGTIGTTLDIIGAPFRYLVELVRYPFLDEAGKKKQRENLGKFDARIREQFREIVNAFTLGLFAKDKGAFGSIYGKEGTDAMGYTKDGKTKSQQVPAKKGTILLSTPDLVATQDLLQGKKSGEKVHSILRMTSEGEDITSELNKPQGLMRGITGAADFMTLGMFDFDQRNRKGAPKDFGVRRIAGGLADYATLGLTDFDKRGAGNFQVNPIFGGKDKAWGSRNEQAKRGEKQSGMGIKRGIGGALDFATLGMFDFDKQNPAGSPKGFGPFRMLAGLTDWMTMGLTDFDKRGAGNFQFDPISGGGDKRWGRERQRRQRPSTNYSYTDNYMKIGGERFIPGQPLTERQYQVATMGMQMGNKYNDEVLRSYAMYEQNNSSETEVIIINKNTTTPVLSGGNSGGTVVNNQVIVDDGQSFERYQGY